MRATSPYLNHPPRTYFEVRVARFVARLIERRCINGA